MAKMNDFLLQYFMQLHFNAMPEEQFAKYTEYLKANDFAGNMKKWRENKLVVTDPATGQWVKNRAYPDPMQSGGDFELDHNEWEKFFKAFQNAFREMSANREQFKDNKDANTFLDEYFGDGTRLFSNSVASSEAETEIQNLATFFKTNKSKLEPALAGTGVFDSDFSMSDFITGLGNKQYNTDPKFREKLKRIVSILEYNRDELQTHGLDVPTDITHIENGFEDSAVDSAKLDFFKNNYSSLLRSLYNNENNKPSKVYDAFKNYGGKITKNLDTAISKVNYTDANSDDYLPPKREDELTRFQKIKKWVGETWEDNMAKYTHLRGDRLYFSDWAKQIVKALDGKGPDGKPVFQATDGLDKLLSNADNIKKNLKYKSPTASKHFGWLIETLGSIKTTMPKAFAGALKNGRQLRAIISELIMKAAKEGKADEAKTAMEVLSVIKYGATTSKVMDALKNEHLGVMSDKGLSWNKNAGIQFITNAMDKTVEFALKTLGYGITIVGNEFSKYGSKFNGHAGKRMGAVLQQNRDQNAQDRNALEQQKNDAVAYKTTQEQRLRDLDSTYGINAANIDNKEQDLATARNAESTLENKIANLNQDKQDALSRESEFKTKLRQNAITKAQIRKQRKELEQDSNDLAKYITNPVSQLSKYGLDDTTGLTADQVKIYQQKAMDLKTDIARQIKDFDDNITQKTDENDQLRRQHLADEDALLPTGIDAQIQTEQNNLNAQKATNDAEASRLNSFRSATNAVSELSNQITKQQDTLDHWDENHKDVIQELAAYWDKLETGRDSNLGVMYAWFGNAKRRQKRFDKKRDNIMALYQNNYSLAA